MSKTNRANWWELRGWGGIDEYQPLRPVHEKNTRLLGWYRRPYFRETIFFYLDPYPLDRDEGIALVTWYNSILTGTFEIQEEPSVLGLIEMFCPFFLKMQSMWFSSSCISNHQWSVQPCLSDMYSYSFIPAGTEKKTDLSILSMLTLIFIYQRTNLGRKRILSPSKENSGNPSKPEPTEARLWERTINWSSLPSQKLFSQSSSGLEQRNYPESPTVLSACLPGVRDASTFLQNPINLFLLYYTMKKRNDSSRKGFMNIIANTQYNTYNWPGIFGKIDLLREIIFFDSDEFGFSNTREK